MSLETLISTYGYAAIGIGTFFEGETILLLGGFAAHRGYLELPWVIWSAFLGSLLGDQLYFYIGRTKGKAMLENRPALKAKSEKVFVLLNRHQTWLILGFRFLYGLRTLTPFLLGASRISPSRFFLLNSLGALAWAVSVGTVGYLFGQALEAVFGDIKKYELIVFSLLAAGGALFWSVQYKRP
jgi:membrane protein DedA with SNARE-associated domain